MRFEGLDPNRHGYSVTLEGGAVYTNSFRTAPGRDTPIRFVSYADCETTHEHFANYTANLLRMKSRGPDLITAIGDHYLFDNADHNVSGGWFHDRQ